MIAARRRRRDIISLKTCTLCKIVKYCNAECQKNHWPTHKKVCKLRAAELRDEASFKDPPAKEDCPICFLPMPLSLICCISLPPATISSVPIRNYAEANEELTSKATEEYYPCCGKSICGGCVDSFRKSGNIETCPYCKAVRIGKTDDEKVGNGHPEKMTVPSASYRCLEEFWPVFHFQTRLYCPYQSETLLMRMRFC
jgi:hypothetical protein